MAMQEEGFKYDKPEGVSWPEFLVSQPEPSCGLSLEQEEQRWQPFSASKSCIRIASEGS